MYPSFGRYSFNQCLKIRQPAQNDHELTEPSYVVMYSILMLARKYDEESIERRNSFFFPYFSPLLPRLLLYVYEPMRSADLGLASRHSIPTPLLVCVRVPIPIRFPYIIMAMGNDPARNLQYSGCQSRLAGYRFQMNNNGN